VLELIILYVQICAVIALVRAAHQVLPELVNGVKEGPWWSFLLLPYLAVIYTLHAWFILFFATLVWPFSLFSKKNE